MKNGLISAARRESEALPWIRGRPFADQSANVCWHTWSPGASAAFPGPEQAKVTSMPGDDGLRLDDMKRRARGARLARATLTASGLPKSNEVVSGAIDGPRRAVSERKDFEMQTRAIRARSEESGAAIRRRSLVEAIQDHT